MRIRTYHRRASTRKITRHFDGRLRDQVGEILLRSLRLPLQGLLLDLRGFLFMLQLLLKQSNYDFLLVVLLLSLELLLKPCDLLPPGCSGAHAFFSLGGGFAHALFPLGSGFAQALLPRGRSIEDARLLLLRGRLGDGNADCYVGSRPESS